jgi:hypothetical protein
MRKKSLGTKNEILKNDRDYLFIYLTLVNLVLETLTVLNSLFVQNN